MTDTASSASSSSTFMGYTIKISKGTMVRKIAKHRHNPLIAFAHTISSDFEHPRRMTAGVAVQFGRAFGKPIRSDCVNSHLTYQCPNEGAGVYGLLTKPNYYCKPTTNDYDMAFNQLTKDFKERKYRHLICSPMGCVRDNIRLEHFISNLKKFQKETGSTVDIVSCDTKAGRVLRRGLSHDEFLSRMEKLLKGEPEASEDGRKDEARGMVTQEPGQAYSSPAPSCSFHGQLE